MPTAPYQEIDPATWERAEYLKWFAYFAATRYAVTVRSDVQKLHAFAKKEGLSFFLLFLYCFLKASNEVREFRHRFKGDKAIEYEFLDVLTPIMLENTTFLNTVRAPYASGLSDFLKGVVPLVEEAKKRRLPLSPAMDQDSDNVVFLSCAPWIHFTGFNPAYLSFHQVMPLFTVGKAVKEGRKLLLPYNIQANHKFIDGFHFGRFVEVLEECFNAPAKL